MRLALRQGEGIVAPANNQVLQRRYFKQMAGTHHHHEAGDV